MGELFEGTEDGIIVPSPALNVATVPDIALNERMDIQPTDGGGGIDDNFTKSGECFKIIMLPS